MTTAAENQKVDRFVVFVVLAAVLYNGVLAIINASVAPLAFSHVALTEITILAAALVFILRKGIYARDLSILLYLLFTFALTVYVSVVNGAPLVDYFRNILIVFCFALVGTSANAQTVKLAFRVACGLVLVVLLMEIFTIDLYENLFYPMKYFENTRGLEQVSFGGSKLFQNAQRIDGRFSFGIIDHRASSLFLEQVSLANFSGALMIFAISFWNLLKRGDRVLVLATIGLILVTNDSRSMLIFALVCFGGYFIFPRMPTYLTALYMPLIIIAGFLVFLIKPDAQGDTLDGRVVLTVSKLVDLDIPAALGLFAARATEFADSGYLYVIYGGTVFGLLAFWLFVTFYAAGDTGPQRRCAHSLSVFIFMNMMIGGTAIFSIKVAGLLWLLVGHLKFANAGRTVEARASGSAGAGIGPAAGRSA
ncbi:hypothetical protein MRS76_01510 [Rhizobiaceae bacterium n13]|uniref:Polymerase n=1 Tax=Ferirhizobium litorale TaxID=2927786 RepID=A0AAE3QB67_9HYPH|nr:hypothetical protein [Fererhizobium litorale]MDI7860620.1 hypothetical protein [Fererhizobium litorale]MDI7920768.1 hypothetical protein [Fererhizobium litorale]